MRVHRREKLKSLTNWYRNMGSQQLGCDSKGKEGGIFSWVGNNFAFTLLSPHLEAVQGPRALDVAAH